MPLRCGLVTALEEMKQIGNPGWKTNAEGQGGEPGAELSGLP